MLDFKFENANLQQSNFPHIDLIDHTNKLAIQVTSQNDSRKIKDAVDGFYKTLENKGYKLKILLISKDAKDYRTKFGENFNHKEDVIDINRLIKRINDIKDLNRIEHIADFLEEQVLPKREETESSEVFFTRSIDFLQCLPK